MDLGEEFLVESREVLRNCSRLLKSLRLNPENSQLLKDLLISADNLVEPSLIASATVLHELASPFRVTLQKIFRSEIPLTQDVLSLLEEACVAMRCLVSFKVMPAAGDIDTTELRSEFEKLWEREAQAGGKALQLKNSTLSMIDILAHDLKSPLALIRASADILLQQKNGVAPEVLRNGLQRILRQSDRGLTLIRDVLTQRENLGGEGTLGRQVLNVRRFLELRLLAHQDAAREKDVALTFEADVKLEISANPTFLGQILDNLLGNALEYSPEKTTVHVKSSGTRLKNAKGITEALLFEVRDSGPGIPKDQLPFIFLEGIQASTGGAGHGLGLAICKRLCELHGGTIWAHSEPGKGTTMTFVLPRDDKA